jgi:hypothetical protein
LIYTLTPPDPDQTAEKIASILQTRCRCGAKMTVQNPEMAGTAVDIICTNPKCRTSYHIPLTDRSQLSPPGSGYLFQPATSYVPAKEYRCKSCKTSIPEAQALRSYEETGQSLCNVCEAKP